METEMIVTDIETVNKRFQRRRIACKLSRRVSGGGDVGTHDCHGGEDCG